MQRRITASPGQNVGWTEDRRRYPRVEVAWAMTLESDAGGVWQGELVSFNPFGTKVTVGAKDPGPPEGTVVQVQFAPPGGEVPMSLEGIVWRVDPNGLAIALLNLSADAFHRLKSLVDTRLGEAVEPLRINRNSGSRELTAEEKKKSTREGL